MHWIQNEKPIEYHVVRWDNSAFHNHDKTDKRKLLGGVSFDGGGAGGGGESGASQGTGVQGVQSSLLDGYGAAIGSGADALGENGRTGGITQGQEGSGKDTVHILQAGAIETAGLAASEAAAVGIIGASDELNKNTVVTESQEAECESRKRSFDYRKFREKMRNGIQAFLQSMKEKPGEKRHKPTAGKERKGTRPVTKEDVYEIQANTAYLLDSYNKRGERSTLGK